MRCSKKLGIAILAMITTGINVSPGRSAEPRSQNAASRAKTTDDDEEIARLSRVAVGLVVTGRKDRYFQAMSLVEVLGRHAQEDVDHTRKQVGDYYNRWQRHFRKSREMGEWVEYYKEMFPSIGNEKRIYEIHWTEIPPSAYAFDAWLRQISTRLTLVSKMIKDTPEPAQKRLDRLIAKSSERKERGLALHRAINYGDRLRALELIASDGVLDVRDSDGWTVLHTAMHWSQADVVVALLEKGVHSNSLTEPDDGATPLDILGAADPRRPSGGEILLFKNFRITDPETLNCIYALTKHGGRGHGFDRLLVAVASSGDANADELVRTLVALRKESPSPEKNRQEN